MNFKEETLQIAQGIASQLGEEFIQEIKHCKKSKRKS